MPPTIWNSHAAVPALALAMAILVAGCSGGGLAPTATPASPVSLPPPDALVLSPREVASGFVLDSAEFKDNRTQARTHSDPDQRLVEFTEWGRVGGFRAGFEKGSTDAMYSSASVYETTDGAADAFRSLNRLVRDEGESLYEEAGYDLSVFETIDAPEIGDDAIVWHFRGKVNEVRLDGIALGWRNGNVLARVTWLGFGLNVLRSDVIALAEIQDRLIESPVEDRFDLPTPPPA